MSTRQPAVKSGFVFIMLVGMLLPLGRQSVQAQATRPSRLKFELYQDAASDFRWRLKSPNGEVLATGGQGYKAKADARNGIDRIKSDVATDKLKFEVYEDEAKKARWRLHASNGQVIATSSQGYVAKADCENAIAVIKRSAADAEVAEVTDRPPA